MGGFEKGDKEKLRSLGVNCMGWIMTWTIGLVIVLWVEIDLRNMTCFESDNEMCFAHSFLKYLWYIKEEAGNRQLGICI